MIKVYSCPPNPAGQEINFRRLQITSNHIGLQITSNQPDFCVKWDKKWLKLAKSGKWWTKHCCSVLYCIVLYWTVLCITLLWLKRLKEVTSGQKSKGLCAATKGSAKSPVGYKSVFHVSHLLKISPLIQKIHICCYIRNFLKIYWMKALPTRLRPLPWLARAKACLSLLLLSSIPMVTCRRW